MTDAIRRIAILMIACVAAPTFFSWIFDSRFGLMILTMHQGVPMPLALETLVGLVLIYGMTALIATVLTYPLVAVVGSWRFVIPVLLSGSICYQRFLFEISTFDLLLLLWFFLVSLLVSYLAGKRLPPATRSSENRGR